MKGVVKLFLRLALGVGFLSAVADRLGWLSPQVSAWGNWQSFVAYTGLINPWLPSALVPAAAYLATAAELVFGIALILGIKTEAVARLSGWLLLVFALAMSFSLGIKKPLDYSVYSASAAAFALSFLRQKFWELDRVVFPRKEKP